MSGGGKYDGLGFGGMFGRGLGGGVAAALLIGVIAIGHAIFRQLEGAAGLVVTFAEIAVCTLLAAAAVAAVGLVAYRALLARADLAERRLTLEQHAREVYAVRAEVLEGAEADGLSPRSARPAILGKRPSYLPGRHLEAVPEDNRGPGDAS